MKIAVCTGCAAVIYPGPYFRKRLIRHLNDGQHNHDAMRILCTGRDGLDFDYKESMVFRSGSDAKKETGK